MSTEAGEVAERLEERSCHAAALYELHASRAGRLAYLLTGDAEVAEDLAQEAFVRLIARLGRIRDEAAIDAYLRRSILNLARKHWRKLGHERAYIRREGASSAVATSAPPDVALRDELWEALGKLRYRQRAAIVLRFYEDLSEKDIARALGCRVGTVKSSVSRGLRLMREDLNDGQADRQ